MLSSVVDIGSLGKGFSPALGFVFKLEMGIRNGPADGMVALMKVRILKCR